mgnify:CR=1 FL=1
MEIDYLIMIIKIKLEILASQKIITIILIRIIINFMISNSYRINT